MAIVNTISQYGLSWFCSPRPAVLWIGISGQSYPNSFELRPVQPKPVWPAQGVDFGLVLDSETLFKEFGFNQHYYKIERTLKWVA